MVMGMSAETFWDGVEGNRAVRPADQGPLRRLERRHRRRGLRAGAAPVRRQEDRRRHAVHPDRRRERPQVLHRARLRGRRDQGPQVPDARSRSPTSASRRCARRSSRSTAPDVDAIVQCGTNLCMADARRRGRALAGQAGHRDQRRHLVDGAARQRHRGQGPRLRLPAARALSRSVGFSRVRRALAPAPRPDLAQGRSRPSCSSPWSSGCCSAGLFPAVEPLLPFDRIGSASSSTAA